MPYILFQRTGYLRLPVTWLYRHVTRRLPVRVPLYDAAVAVESRLDRGRVARLYAADMAGEYRTLAHALPARCDRLLDIGCGMAGIDVLLDRHYAARGQQLALALLDHSEVTRNVYYLFEQRAAFYSSLDVAADLLAANGIARERITLLAATERNEIAIDRAPLDLVVSLLSWGFHYSVETYLARVRELLSDDGVVILDVRKGTAGREALRRAFGSVALVHDGGKFERVVATRPV